MIVPLAVGAGLLAAGALLSVRHRLTGLGLLAQLAGCVVLAGAGIAVLADHGRVGSPFVSELSPRFGLDGLSAFFLAVVALTSMPALLYARDALRRSEDARSLTALTALFILALVGVLVARDVISFLAFWELMTLVPAGAILVARRDAAARRTAFSYLAVTHLGGVGVWLALLLLAHEQALGAVLHDGTLAVVVAVAAVVGFGTKAGVVPLHAWLPRAHPAAPSHVSALMSAVMVKVALYGMIRVLFEWLPAPGPWVGLGLMALGLVTALGGVLYALVERELKRLLAFSSVENVGIIVLALGASLVLEHQGEPGWAAVAFAAALLHVANHAAFKGLLFLGAGAFAHAVGTLDLDRLGGLLRRMPWTGAAFLLGCAAVAGLPPLNGFVSEWLTLQSLLQLAFGTGPVAAAMAAIAVAGLAATAALAAYCFVRVVGLTLLGAPRSDAASDAREEPRQTRAALGVLAAACVLLGALPGFVLPALAELMPGPSSLPGDPRGVSIDLAQTGGFPALGLVVGFLAAVVVIAGLTGGRGRGAPVPTWTCGQPVVASLSWTSAGFTKPLRLVLEALYRPRRGIEVRRSGVLVEDVVYRSEVPHLFDTALYRPVLRRSLRLAAAARRLQSGSLRTYVLYLLALLIAGLAAVRFGGLS